MDYDKIIRTRINMPNEKILIDNVATPEIIIYHGKTMLKFYVDDEVKILNPDCIISITYECKDEKSSRLD